MLLLVKNKKATFKTDYFLAVLTKMRTADINQSSILLLSTAHSGSLEKQDDFHRNKDERGIY